MTVNTNSGFIDLRIGHGARTGDDSIWPSFTDIMTVIVMIFLMALVIMMVRNFELDRQLVTTETSREQGLAANRNLLNKIRVLESGMAGLRESLGSSEGARETLQTQLLAELRRIELMVADNHTLEEQLAAIIAERDRLSREKQTQATQSAVRIAALTANEAALSLRIGELAAQFDDLKLQSAGEVNTLNTANLSLTQRLDEVSAQLSQVNELLQAEQQQRRALGTRLQEQDREIADKQALLGQLQSRQSAASEQYEDARGEIDRLTRAINQRQLENAALKKLADASGERFRSLRDEYESLGAKYRDLARPARTAAGKNVVDVWILSAAGDGDGDENKNRFRLQEKYGEPENYNRADLNDRLAALKEKHGANLYTKIIIPESSNLTHNEAWRITQEILREYDYYYQR